MDNIDVKLGDNLLIISSNQTQSDEKLVQSLISIVGEQSVTSISNQQLNNDTLNSRTFDAIITYSKLIDSELLAKLINYLKLNSKLAIIKQNDCQTSRIITELKLNGYVDIRETIDEIIANKPNYEIGSSVQLNLSNGNKQTAKVWSLAAMDIYDDSVELINDDDLLDDEDLKKPSTESLRVCGTTKQRKACADCSCGLAEELEKEVIESVRKNTQNAKSSCGSCYLGDAFRCAGCPYLGMPAFKAGEKVVLDNSSDL